MTSTGLVSYELERLADFDDARWAWLGVASTLLIYGFWTWWRYRRELPDRPASSTGLTLLRLSAAAAGILFFLGLVKRVDQRLVSNSRVVVLADVSQSMAIEDERAREGERLTRIDAIRRVVVDSPLLSQLRAEHEVAVGTFDADWRRLVRWPRRQIDADSTEATPATDAIAGINDAQGSDEANQEEPNQNDDANWQDGLQAQGTETRLGDALAHVLAERTAGAGPLAGVVVLSDGRQNGGLDAMDAARRAAAAHVRLVTIGVGSEQPRRNARVQELIVPSRGYPDDRVLVRVLVGAEGMDGRRAAVELYVSEVQATAASAQTRVGREMIALPPAGELATVEFPLSPSQVGRLELEARLVGAEDDQYAADDRRSAEMEIVETRLRALLIAGGASRDYQFLRNQLHRDPHAAVDVLLQLSPPGISQDASAILDRFPQTKEELFEYDVIVGFDPDWTRLDAQQVELLEQWVAEEAGGLIVEAGPVHLPAWVQSVEHQKIRALYPVQFQRRLTLLDDGIYGSATPWPIELTRAGEEAEFLWLKPTPDESREQWRRFPGVFGCYAVKGPKPGAVVYGRYGDPDAGLSVERPVYMAQQFYGAGRVFYLGSGELWRLRGIDPGLFETLTTQLLRHVSQGRLLRGSSRGRLLVERDRFTVGETVVVRAQLSTLRREPFVAPQTTARVTGPDGAGQNLILSADPNRPGSFLGQFGIPQEGSYRIELPIPESLDEQLSRRIQASTPDREFAETQRDGQLLAELALLTEGRYFADWETAAGADGAALPAGRVIESKAEVKTVRGKPDALFTQTLHKALLAVLCGALCAEWLGRRLLKLA